MSNTNKITAETIIESFTNSLFCLNTPVDFVALDINYKESKSRFSLNYTVDYHQYRDNNCSSNLSIPINTFLLEKIKERLLKISSFRDENNVFLFSKDKATSLLNSLEEKQIILQITNSFNSSCQEGLSLIQIEIDEKILPLVFFNFKGSVLLETITTFIITFYNYLYFSDKTKTDYQFFFLILNYLSEKKSFSTIDVLKKTLIDELKQKNVTYLSEHLFSENNDLANDNLFEYIFYFLSLQKFPSRYIAILHSVFSFNACIEKLNKDF